MGRKRKNNAATVEQEHRWKPMPIQSTEGLSREDFEGLVGIEELTDYQMFDSKKFVPRDDDHDSAPKPKKKKKKKTGEKNGNLKKKKPSEINQFVVEVIYDEDEAEKEQEQANAEKEQEQANAEKEQEQANAGEVETIEEENFVPKKLNMSQWKALSVPRPIIKCLASMQMTSPTAIQKASIKQAIEGRVNVYGAAPTGSGKTLAFGIPLLAHIIKDQENEDEDYVQKVRAIVLTPTRELAVQIKNHLESINNHSTVKVALIVGGLAIQKQERILMRIQPDILVATPGRLWEIIANSSVSYLNADTMSSLRYLVIDEADRMVEKSHFAELRELINLWLSTEDKSIWDERQVFIFSATLTMTKDKKKSKKAKVKESESEDLIQLLRLDRNTLSVHDLTEGGKYSTPSSEQLQESVINCMKEEKDLYLFYFVALNPGKTIVFCNSIDCIRRLTNIANFLRLCPLSVHSSMPQKRRLLAIERFTSRDNALLLATDVAARGLDIANVDHVVHYQVPRTAEIYIHRSGRTARVAAKGLSLILCEPQEEAFFLKDFCRILNKPNLEKFTIDSRILRKVKERIRLAQRCDQLEHQLRKEKSSENWFRTTAKACDLVMDDSDEMDSDTDASSLAKSEHFNNRRKLRACQHQLDALLKQSLVYRDRL